LWKPIGSLQGYKTVGIGSREGVLVAEYIPVTDTQMPVVFVVETIDYTLVMY
jgi:hypothetical protein